MNDPIKSARFNYWYYRPNDNWPPSTVEEPGLLRSDGRLSVSCTQTQRSSSQQRKLVDQWCDILPTLQGVRHLWFNTRVPQRLFDAACKVPNLESLYIEWSGIKNIAALEYATTLRYLHIGGSAGLESIDPLTSMHSLAWLGLENVKRITSLEPIAGLQQLKGLSVEGSMWTTQRLQTLAPIAQLKDLIYLSITNLRTDDKTLSPLFSLRKLEAFNAARWWDEAELAELERLNPGLGASA